MGYTVWVSLTRPRPLDGDELERLNEHVARHQRADWPEPYLLKLTLGGGLALTARMKVGYEADLIERFLGVLTELRGVVPDAAVTAGDDLQLVHWDGAAFVQRGPATREPESDRAEKVALTKVKRENGLMYYVKSTGVWAVPRKRPGEAKGAPILIAEAAIAMDYANYLYFVDGDGDVARKLRRSD